MKLVIAYLTLPIHGYTDSFGIDITKNEMERVNCENYQGMCTRELRPLCDNNGARYGNPCAFLTAYCNEDSTIRFRNWGNCMLNDDVENSVEESEESEVEKCNFMCDRMSEPVCGSDGIKYPNECILKAKNCVEGTDIRVRPCDIQCQKPCPRIFAPVCGSDGITYSNTCTLDVAICEQSKDSTENFPSSIISLIVEKSMGSLIIFEYPGA